MRIEPNGCDELLQPDAIHYLRDKTVPYVWNWCVIIIVIIFSQRTLEPIKVYGCMIYVILTEPERLSMMCCC